jgi:hypothetical protein
MASATLNIKILPRRMLSGGEAAAYCGLPAKQFPAVCNVSPIVMPGGRKLYDLQELDTWFDHLKNGASESDHDILGRLNA